MDIGIQNQIFIDGRFLAEKDQVRIVVQRPLKTGEQNIISGVYTIIPEQPHQLQDGPEFWVYAQVLENDGVFKGFSFLSQDGVSWQEATPARLKEGDFAYGLWLPPGESDPGGAVFLDPQAPEAERYKIVSGYHNKVYSSSDGGDWSVTHEDIFPPEVVFPKGMDSQNVAFYDDGQKCYVAYVRVNKRYAVPPQHQAYFDKSSYHGQTNHLRCVGRYVSDNLRSFSGGQIVLEPDAQDPIMDGVGVADFYMPQVIVYPYAQDAYVMFPNNYLHYQDWFIAEDLTGFYSKGGQEVYNVGPLDISFAASRDGIHWQRYDRGALIPLGPSGEFDSGAALYPVRGIIFQGDEMWLYYIASNGGHFLPEEGHQIRNIMSRVIFRRDGFTAVEADYTGGEFTTPPLTFSGNELHLNIETSALGLARVEIQDEFGKPLPGFALDDCDRIHTTNSTNRVVSWRKGQKSIEKWVRQPVRFRFELRYGAKLYAFRTERLPP